MLLPIFFTSTGFLPEELDKLFVKYLYPTFTPTVGLFFAGTVAYGVLKYLQNEKVKEQKWCHVLNLIVLVVRGDYCWMSALYTYNLWWKRLLLLMFGGWWKKLTVVDVFADSSTSSWGLCLGLCSRIMDVLFPLW